MAALCIPTPNRLEELALFRYAIVGDLIISELPRGELNDELRRRAQRRYRSPGSPTSRTFHWKTLQRWLLAARQSLAELQPASRERGFGLVLTAEARELLLDIRREHPSASAEIILDAAVQHGVIDKDAISLPTLRRLFVRAGISRRSKQRHERAKDRRRWQTDRVGRIWHADVCHVWRQLPDGSTGKVYVHAILDDHSRYVVAMRACVAETENDLLELLVEALLRYPAPDVFYVDNGATYRGDLLTLALDRLGVRTLHAAPYDPQARGKMERFWRTLRQRLLDHVDEPMTLHTMNVALSAWLDTDYHSRQHGGLMGDRPGRRFRAGLQALPAPKTTAELARALQISRTAKVRKDATFSVKGTQYEVRGRHLCGKTLTLQLDPFTDAVLELTYDGLAVPYGLCDAQRNANRGRGAPDKAVSKADPRFARISRVLQAAREVVDEA